MEPTKVELRCAGRVFEPDGFEVVVFTGSETPLIKWWSLAVPPEGDGVLTWWMDEGSRMHTVPVRIEHEGDRLAYLEPTDFVRTYIDGGPAGPLTRMVGDA